MVRVFWQGFSLIEVLVAMLITTVGLLGIASMQLQSNRAVQDSNSHSQAVWLVIDLINRMHANRSALAEYATEGEYSCANPPIMCADYYASNAASCDGQQMAKFDLWEVSCRRNSQWHNLLVRSSHADFINNPRLQVRVEPQQRTAVIKLIWDKRPISANDSQTANTQSLERTVRL